MSIAQKGIRIFAGLFVIALMIMIALPYATRQSDAATFGGFVGVSAGGTIRGKVNIQALASADVVRVNFQLSGPTALTYIDRAAPFYYNGDTNGTPAGWDTTTIPDGAYILKATLIDAAGKRLTNQVSFTVANLVVPTAIPTQAASVYTDGISSGWIDWSWNINANYSAAVPHQGATSVGVTFAQPWSGFYLHNDTLTQATAVRFWINGGSVANRQIGLFATDITGTPYRLMTVTPAANTWTQVTAPISSVIPSGRINGIIWQEGNGAAQPIFYLDDIALVTSPTGVNTVPTAIPTQVIQPTAIPITAPTAVPTQAVPPTVVPTSVPSAPLPAGSFLQTFDGTPAAPQPWNPANWDITVHSRDVSTWTSLEPMKAEHGAHCEAPTDASGNLVTHDITGSYADSVFMCNNHVMTAIKASGYGLIYLVPPALVDFSRGDATVRFDVSTDRTSQRDFLDFWLSPWDENVAAPFDMGDVDLQGWARDAIQIGMISANGNGTGFKPIIFKNFVDTGEFQPFTNSYNWYTGYEQMMKVSPQKRTTFELTISKTHIRFGMPGGQVDINGNPVNNGQPFYWVDKDINPLTWDKAVIQFGHHSYNPEKNCGTPGTPTCSANTWHWDNISISPAQPFTIIRGDRRYTDANSPNNTINFPQPAPANSYLHFTGISNENCYTCAGAGSPPVELSFDGGKTWQPATKQAVSKPMNDPFAHAASYWTPIPAGVSSVQVRPRQQTAGNGGITWYVKDLSIWSQTTAGVAAVANPVNVSAFVPASASGELAHAANLFVCDLQVPSPLARSATVAAQPASPFSFGLASPLWSVLPVHDIITKRFFLNP